jgi:hypothetical protein
LQVYKEEEAIAFRSGPVNQASAPFTIPTYVIRLQIYVGSDGLSRAIVHSFTLKTKKWL